MKKYFIFLSFLSAIYTQAQWKINYDREEKFTEQDEKTFSWGYFIGLNHFDFKITPRYTDKTAQKVPPSTTDGIDDNGKFLVSSETNIGFSAGLMGRYRINDYLDLWLTPGIHFTERSLIFENHRSAETKESIEKIKSTYLDLPLSVNFHGERWFNTRPFIQLGLGYGANLQSNQKSEDDIFKLKTHNINWQAEAGINIYFRRFKFTPSVKGIFFLNNELEHTPWENISSLNTRAIVLSLKFE